MILRGSLFLLFLFQLHFIYSQSQTDKTTPNVHLTIDNVRSSKGVVYIAFFYSNEHFAGEDKFERIAISKKDLVNGTLKTSIYLPPGTIGLSLLDDEDNDGEMDKNFIGIPREGFGFSNYEHKGFSKPVFDDFKFEVKTGQSQRIWMKIRYL